nr:hypothetical transcript [Hymenolepis microstoma]
MMVIISPLVDFWLPSTSGFLSLSVGLDTVTGGPSPFPPVGHTGGTLIEVQSHSVKVFRQAIVSTIQSKFRSSFEFRPVCYGAAVHCFSFVRALSQLAFLSVLFCFRSCSRMCHWECAVVSRRGSRPSLRQMKNPAKELAISESVKVTKESECALAINLVGQLTAVSRLVRLPFSSLFSSVAKDFQFSFQFFKHSTEGSAEVVVCLDKDDFSY